MLLYTAFMRYVKTLSEDATQTINIEIKDHRSSGTCDSTFSLIGSRTFPFVIDHNKITPVIEVKRALIQLVRV